MREKFLACTSMIDDSCVVTLLVTLVALPLLAERFSGAGCEARTRSRHPTKGLRARPFTTSLPTSVVIAARGAVVKAESFLHQTKNRTSKPDVLFNMERATRLELATSTLARWRSTR